MKNPLKALLLFLLLAWSACKEKPAARKPPEAKQADTVAAESQKINFAKKFPRAGISKVVSYSFMDEEEDVFEDSANKGQLLQIMPWNARYLRKNDPRPKVILKKAQIASLLSIIHDPRTYKHGSAMCYNPRNIFCFYNDRNEIVAYYEVCFECSKFDAGPAITDTLKDIGLSQRGADALDKFCRSAGITIK